MLKDVILVWSERADLLLALRARLAYTRAMRLLILLLPALPALAAAQSKSVDWPVYGGSPEIGRAHV